jgi:hypothetical protein
MTTTEYLSQPVNFGGITVTLYEAISTMRAEGHPERLIDRWVQGALLSARLGR